MPPEPYEPVLISVYVSLPLIRLLLAGLIIIMIKSIVETFT